MIKLENVSSEPQVFAYFIKQHVLGIFFPFSWNNYNFMKSVKDAAMWSPRMGSGLGAGGPGSGQAPRPTVPPRSFLGKWFN